MNLPYKHCPLCKEPQSYHAKVEEERRVLKQNKPEWTTSVKKNYNWTVGLGKVRSGLRGLIWIYEVKSINVGK